MRYIPLKRKIDDLEVYCPNQEEGCKEITKLGELDAHKNGCGFAKIICTQGCEKSILRKDLTRHCSDDCSKRKIKCKYCGKVDHYEVINGEHMTACEEYPVKCPRECMLPSGIKRKDLAKHAEVCPLEMVQCPFIEAECDTRILRKDLYVHMESNTQQHLMKMMTAYSLLKLEHSKLKFEHSMLKLEHTTLHEEHDKLSSRVANLTITEPVKLTLPDGNGSFTFSITSSRGWISPPFSVLDGYTFSIIQKKDKKASLMLLKGKCDDQLKWPMNILYFELEICIQEPRKKTPWNVVYTVRLQGNLERVSSTCSKEITDIDLPERELLYYEVVVRLVPIILSLPPRKSSSKSEPVAWLMHPSY
jgi:hypothetical protein